MRAILVLNSKGGCGKTMLATNLAAYYALQGKSVALADFDPQASSLAWLAARPADCPAIAGLAAHKEAARAPHGTDYVIMDAPAGIAGADLTGIVRRAQTILIPVLPSATDIRATARFVHHLLLLARVSRNETRLATVANRVLEAGALEATVEQTLNGVGVSYESVATRIYRPLERFLERLRIPFVAALRNSPNYALADDQGLSIFESDGPGIHRDRVQWQPLFDWLDSRRSLPRAR